MIQTLQFTNPRGLSAARRACTTGFSVWGDAIWDALCATGSNGEHFDLGTVVDNFHKYEGRGLARRTVEQYVRGFFLYAQAVPEEFFGPRSRLTRIRKNLYYLADGPQDPG